MPQPRPQCVIPLLLVLAGCGEENTGPSRSWTADTLVTGLEYPTGLAVAGGTVYLTETAGRNTGFGGKVQLDEYVVSTGAFSLLLDHPANSDALAVTASGDIYLTSYVSVLPGDQGDVSVVDGVTLVESPVTGLAIASSDMVLDQSGDIYILGASDTPGAASLYRLSASDYTDTTVVKRGLGRATALARYGDDTFFSDLTGIKRLSPTGSVTPVLQHAGIISLAVAGQFLYFADFLAGEIGRVNLNNGAVDPVLEGLSQPLAIRYDAGSNRLYLLDGGTLANEFKDGVLAVISNLD